MTALPFGKEHRDPLTEIWVDQKVSVDASENLNTHVADYSGALVFVSQPAWRQIAEARNIKVTLNSVEFALTVYSNLRVITQITHD